MQAIKRVEFQRAVGGILRHQAQEILERGSEIKQPKLFADAVQAIRHEHCGRVKITVNAVVGLEMGRVMASIRKANQPKGTPGYSILSSAELLRASELDPVIAPAIAAARSVFAD